ncbi:MAG: hypothetical protein AAFV33_29260, partial [Chloroflexota bacterium]
MHKTIAVFTTAIALFLIITGTTFAQTDSDNTCAAYVEEALVVTDEACANGTRNSICYGNIQIDSTLRTDDVNFETTGDTVSVADIETMLLAPLDIETDTWGVAVASVQANLPGTVPGQLVTMIVFGDTELTPADGNLSAFTFTGGIGRPSCDEAPNGLLIQTPDGAAEVTFNVNGIDVAMGSTAYIVAEPNDDLLFALLEGEADVTADGATEQITGGEFTTIPLDASAQASGAPTEPEPIIYGDEGIVLPSVVSVNNALMPQRVEIEVVSSVGVDPDATEEATVVVSGPIQPLDGTWTASAQTVNASGGCPAPVVQGLQQGASGFNESASLVFSKPFSLEALFSD